MASATGILSVFLFYTQNSHFSSFPPPVDKLQQLFWHFLWIITLMLNYAIKNKNFLQNYYENITLWGFHCISIGHKARASSNPPVVPAKGSYGTEGQLHTVIEKSPESSPTTKPRQGGGFSQPHSPSGHSPVPPDLSQQPGSVILPSGKYPLPQPEPHYSGPAAAPTGVYPVLAKEQHGLQSLGGRKDGEREEQRDGRQSATQNGYQHFSSPNSTCAFAPTQLRAEPQKADR